MNILILDNFDSFTFNLYQCVGEILVNNNKNFAIDVARNNEITIEKLKITTKNYHFTWPGDPSDPQYFGVCAKVLTEVGGQIPVLGVCLGMQGMAYYFGGKVVRAKAPMHGKTSYIQHDGKGLFKDLPQDIEVMRYHSLVAEKKTLPKCLKITALSNDTKEIMGLRHKEFPIEGIQFHPESFATEGGKLLLTNFLFTPK